MSMRHLNGNGYVVEGPATQPEQGSSLRGTWTSSQAQSSEIAEVALQKAGASLADVVRTRVMLTDIGRWREAVRAHADRFAQVRPACTFVEVSRFIENGWWSSR
jgi:enamine deaminase RidA (YjgF/YER057c/UK114 family)